LPIICWVKYSFTGEEKQSAEPPMSSVSTVFGAQLTVTVIRNGWIYSERNEKKVNRVSQVTQGQTLRVQGRRAQHLPSP